MIKTLLDSVLLSTVLHGATAYGILVGKLTSLQTITLSHQIAESQQCHSSNSGEEKVHASPSGAWGRGRVSGERVSPLLCATIMKHCPFLVLAAGS